jgi:Protein of unknown function (DUF3632)
VSDSTNSKTSLDEWVNLSSFLARCIESGIDDNNQNSCRCAGFDIINALEKPLRPSVYRDRRVMVAAQHILLAGRVIYEWLIKTTVKGLEEWRLWAIRFRALADDMEDKESELKSATKQAYEKVVSLHPDVFFISEGGSKPDITLGNEKC